ncbi:uncharacterized protein LOC123561698 [Mercenaria mercenaria]|uniref:uncharacterized protein LOC123561698 n=1 Tax=Mercenaria mercenaria TaxID=6596 RepID=UPI001E1D7832|nr:uncharacterized protein LOC123561698 [Mercenaria mercenaria]XP_053408970.1 uncharacterized protein LOC123561698 [Mercenaria mercenaria]
MAASKLTILKFVGFAVGLAAKFVTGSIFVFNVYQDAIKTNFNYTQTEVELLASMLNAGLGVGFVPGMFYDKFGPTLTSGAGLIVSVPVYLLMWSTVKYTSFYSKNVWLMAIYFLLAGFGSVFTYMVALNTNVINFSSNHTGKIVGFLNAVFAGSPSVFATVYYNLFTTGDSTIAENQDFAGFMLFLAILYGVVNIVCMFFLRIYTDPENKEDVSMTYYKDKNGIVLDELTIAVNGKSKSSEKSSENLDTTKDTPDNENEPLSVAQILCSIDFHLFVWMFAFASCVAFVYLTNLTVTSKSVHLDQYNNKLTLIIPITNAIVSAAIGILSDIFKDKIPRLVIVVLGCCAIIVSLVLVIVFADKLILLIVATVFTGIGVGIIWSLCPTIMKEMFSVQHLGRNWGIALLLSALVSFGIQEIFGTLYDSKVPEGEVNICYGINCVREGYGVFIGISVLAFCMGILILIRQRCCKCGSKTDMPV